MTTLPDPLPTHANFARHLGEAFRLRVAADRVVDVDLVEAKTGRGAGTHPGSPDRPFSLVFRSRGPAGLPQRIYRVEHPRLGVLDLFLVPLGPDDVGMRFEAVFN